jgi:ribosomal protein L7/L12
MTQLSDIVEQDTSELASNLTKIRDLADSLAALQTAGAHEIYKLARDSLEILCWDQISRDTFKKLTGVREFRGYTIGDTVDAYIRAGKLINAIKELRSDTGLDLKGAKDLVDAYRASIGQAPF